MLMMAILKSFSVLLNTERSEGQKKNQRRVGERTIGSKLFLCDSDCDWATEMNHCSLFNIARAVAIQRHLTKQECRGGTALDGANKLMCRNRLSGNIWRRFDDLECQCK